MRGIFLRHCVTAASAVAKQMSSSKRAKMVRIGTHSGSFHCDEALGCFILRQTADFKNAEIVRSRDTETLAGLDVVIDVGGVYDPATARYDHHQRDFKEVFGHGFTTKLSSAGLVYKHYGREVVAGVMGLDASHPDVETVYLAVYKKFMEAVDAIDNGINQWDAEGPPKYISRTDLGSRVAGLNPFWNDEDQSAERLMEQFLKAVELTGSEFLDSINYHSKVWLPGRSYVVEALAERKAADPSGRIIVLRHFCPWKEHLYDLEAEQGIEGQILYVLYEDDREKKWRIQAVSQSPGSFESRHALPAAWRGLRDEELSKSSGVPGGVFVHASGFIGGAATEEGVLAMARLALPAQES
ncbi:MYG1 [Auxenochlorella protothecoides x Auxenochlorella symbiontica]